MRSSYCHLPPVSRHICHMWHCHCHSSHLPRDKCQTAVDPWRQVPWKHYGEEEYVEYLPRALIFLFSLFIFFFFIFSLFLFSVFTYFIFLFVSLFYISVYFYSFTLFHSFLWLFCFLISFELNPDRSSSTKVSSLFIHNFKIPCLDPLQITKNKNICTYIFDRKLFLKIPPPILGVENFV